ncbi:peptide ABC transporter substrate-binding protein [Enterococcus casseliflavus]|uniref:peptide ABC transporter substrate-binding protein n=1 Tax=Enterococcus casseliflavus TaxID=37734 RepID=UPI002FBD5913
MGKRSKYGVSLVLLGSLFLAACQNGNEENETDSSAASSAEQVINVQFSAEMGSADISLATDSYSFITLNNAYEGLYRLDENNVPVIAGASEDAEVSEDGLSYTISLREEAKWSNGDPVTAADYVFSWQRTVDPATASNYAYMLAPVKNATAISDGTLDKSELGIEAVNDHELKITLEKPTPYFLSLLAFPTFFPQNERVVEEFGDQYALTSENAAYNGPFLLTNYAGPGTDIQWTLAKNPDYWDADSVKLETINFDVVKDSSTAYNLYESGQADDIILSGELAMQNVNHPDYIVQPSATTQYLEMNQAPEDSPFRNANLRQAISYSMNRQQIVDNILGNGSLPAVGFVPSDLAFNPETKADFVEDAATTLAFDEEKAQEYWEKARAELGIDTLSFELLTSDTDQSKKMAEYIQGTLQQTLDGLTVEVTNVPFSVRLDRSNSGDFEMVMNNWIGDYADPINFLELFKKDSSYNRGKWLNDDYNQLIEQASNENANDPEARWENMVAAEKILNDDLGVIPLFQSAEAHLRSSKIKGLIVHSVGAAYDYKNVFVEE